MEASKNILRDDRDIRKGGQQGCILSPMLFNAYVEDIFAKDLEDYTDDIEVTAKVINYFLTQTKRHGENCRLHRRISKPPGQNKEDIATGLQMNNSSKTKFLSRDDFFHTQLNIDGREIERINLSI